MRSEVRDYNREWKRARDVLVLAHDETSDGRALSECIKKLQETRSKNKAKNDKKWRLVLITLPSLASQVTCIWSPTVCTSHMRPTRSKQHAHP